MVVPCVYWEKDSVKGVSKQHTVHVLGDRLGEKGQVNNTAGLGGGWLLTA